MAKRTANSAYCEKAPEGFIAPPKKLNAADYPGIEGAQRKLRERKRIAWMKKRRAIALRQRLPRTERVFESEDDVSLD